MVDRVTNARGMHWYADKTEHREILHQRGAIGMERKGGHTMNRRYLWLMELPEFQELGLCEDEDLKEWVQPQLSPLRKLAK